LVVERTSLYGTSSIGVFVIATNEYALIPEDVPSKFFSFITSALSLDDDSVIPCSVNGSRIIGALVAGNSSGLILPKTITPNEFKLIKDKLGDKVIIEVLSSKYTALGNLILANDRAALVYEGFTSKALRIISDVLDVEVIKGKIANIHVVGSAAAVNNKGLMLHPQATAEEVRTLSKLFKVQTADVGTVNRGKPFIRSGLIVNDRGAIVGDETTGPELVHIEQIFGLIEV